jgi:hypothetical protein
MLRKFNVGEGDLDFQNDTLGEALAYYQGLVNKYGADSKINRRYGWDGDTSFTIWKTREETPEEELKRLNGEKLDLQRHRDYITQQAKDLGLI